ncbi:NADH dehydrogenase (ubiquinone) 24 kDa subunit [Nostoc commune NIES-4072]|uniref:NADH dehydrogenase (Ubiquinone) 24 kDa subunit n=1 Tax=Nostoc commune NIES-4072 TaxID=2005467 RepID=A0A2R5FSY3_NOSCO|nr:NADH dehydrogenase (ubiquinone) 24 kDa subunit [Nostoc commune HK-02]GBG19303.1 NADH dehydrogenase (ubiquinone) 24 kDa subunit [Nostoc commune NIES-4072]
MDSHTVNKKSPLKEHPSDDKRFKILDATMKRHQYQQDALIEVLHKAQELFAYLDRKFSITTLD